MPRQVSLDEARTHLLELLEAVKRGETILIADNGQPVAQLVAVNSVKRRPRFGSARGLVVIADDFEAPLKDFSLKFPGQGT